MSIARRNAYETERESDWKEYGLFLSIFGLVVSLFVFGWVNLEASLDRTNQLYIGLRSDMTTEFGSVRSETKTESKILRSEMKTEFRNMRSEFANLRSDTRNEFTNLGSEHGNEIRSVRSELRGVREELQSLGKAVGRIERKLDQVTDDKDADTKLASNTES